MIYAHKTPICNQGVGGSSPSGGTNVTRSILVLSSAYLSAGRVAEISEQSGHGSSRAGVIKMPARRQKRARGPPARGDSGERVPSSSVGAQRIGGRNPGCSPGRDRARGEGHGYQETRGGRQHQGVARLDAEEQAREETRPGEGSGNSDRGAGRCQGGTLTDHEEEHGPGRRICWPSV